MTVKMLPVDEETEAVEPLEGQQTLPMESSSGDQDNTESSESTSNGDHPKGYAAKYSLPVSHTPTPEFGATAQQVHRAVLALPKAEQRALDLACESYPTKKDRKEPILAAGFRSLKQHGLTLDRAVRLIRMAIGFHGTVEELVDLLVAGRMAAALAGPDGAGTSSSSPSISSSSP